MSQRYTIKFGGESGQGINTLGKLLNKAVKNAKYPNFAYREYPSLIKGGVASYQIDISEKQINSSSIYTNLLAVLDKDALHQYLTSVKEYGTIIHDIKDLELSEPEKEYLKDNNIALIYLDVKKLTEEVKAPPIMANMVTLGFIFKALNLDIKILKDVVKEHFSKKQNIDIEAEYRCLDSGYTCEETEEIKTKSPLKKKTNNWNKSLTLTGNDAIALGAISAGLRAYYAYPMTPATSILKTLGNTYKETGILIKQTENEITAAQMVLGSMYMGTRAMTATSGGGFDLMTETISCAGISETPMVIILAQRNGPGTGVPTWSGAGDINVAIKGGHGEFPRCVLSLSNATDSYELTQKAFNIADKYQLPVIILTEKQISESIFNIKDLPKPIKIEQNFTEGKARYRLTENGISPRWKPSNFNEPYLHTSDEHDQQGWSSEQPQEIISQMEKRYIKLKTLQKDLPEPIYTGPKDPDTIFITYGSSKNAVQDVMNTTKEKIGNLHYEYLYPLKTEPIIKHFEEGARLVVVENNQTGQFTSLIKETSGFEIPEKILKFDGRPIFIEDILDYLKQ